MFPPEESIGIEATEYLLDLGFMCEPVSVYMGEKTLDQDILDDDGHPEHSTMLEELCENSETCIHFYLNEYHLEILWSNADIISVSDNFPLEIISTLNDFLDDSKSIVYISNEKLVEFQDEVDSEGGQQGCIFPDSGE